MKDAKPTRSGKITEDLIEHATQASERPAREFAESASRVKDAAARVSDQAMRAGVEMLQRNAETAQHTLESGAKLASTMAERSASQLGRAFSFSGEELAAQRASRNIEGIVQASTIVTEMMQRMSEEWEYITRARIERGFDRMGALMQYRTPQDIAAFQSEVLRDNIETFLGFARKMGEHSTRLADEAKRRFGSVADVMTSRQDTAGGRGQTAQRKPAHQAARRKSAHKRSARVGEATARRRGPSRKAT